jgi:hypothetical protein
MRVIDKPIECVHTVLNSLVESVHSRVPQTHELT